MAHASLASTRPAAKTGIAAGIHSFAKETNCFIVAKKGKPRATYNTGPSGFWGSLTRVLGTLRG